MKENHDLKRFAAFLALNFCLSLAVSSFFLFFAGRHPLELAFAAVALVSNTLTLCAAVSLPALLLFWLGRGPLLPGALLGLFQLLLVTDAGVYKIFKFHLNSMVVNLVLTPGGLDSLEQGWGMKLFYVLLSASMLAAQLPLWRLSEKLRGSLSRRSARAAAGVLLLFVLADKGIFAWGTLYDSVYITRNAQLYPLYQPLRIRSFARKYLGVKLDTEVRGGIDKRYSGLVYPLAPLRVERPAKPLNFVVLVVDSLRRDMLKPDIMPETWALGRKGAVFTDHYSGGNCTRFGVFSVFYGIYGNYWFDMLGERRPPVLMDELQAQGYDVRLYASAKLSFPEFDKTAFARVPRAGVYDEPDGADVVARDRRITEKFVSYLRSRRPGSPYFAFVFYDASHGAYGYPPEFGKFKPAANANRLALNKDNIGPLFNMYKNSVYYDDHLVGEILKAIAAAGGMKDTVILVMGDHGEAFLERGRYGHNQGYSPEEVRVPLVLYVPGRKPLVSAAMTSHLDIAPTLMPLLGVKNPPSDYSSGRSLFDASTRSFVPCASWDTAAIITSSGTLEMPLEAYKGGVKAFDAEYREEGKKAARAYTPLIVKFQKEASRFSK